MRHASNATRREQRGSEGETGAVVSWLLNTIVRVVAFVVVAAAVTLQFDASCSEACHIVVDRGGGGVEGDWIYNHN